jgi:hypothetical protein
MIRYVDDHHIGQNKARTGFLSAQMHPISCIESKKDMAGQANALVGAVTWENKHVVVDGNQSIERAHLSNCYCFILPAADLWITSHS